jgi:hypothetical protein
MPERKIIVGRAGSLGVAAAMAALAGAPLARNALGRLAGAPGGGQPALRIKRLGSTETK